MGKVLGAVGVALLLVALFLGACAAGDTNFTNLVTSGDVTAGGNVSATGNVTAGGNLTVDDFLIFDKAASNVAVTAGSTITPLASYQPLTAAGNVTCSTSTCVANGTTTGQIILLTNIVTYTITIDGTGGNVECSSDRALGANDNVMLMWNGADWQCVGSFTNN